MRSTVGRPSAHRSRRIRLGGQGGRNWGAATFKTFTCEFVVSQDPLGSSLCKELGQAVPSKVPLWRQGGGYSEMSLQKRVPGQGGRGREGSAGPPRLARTGRYSDECHGVICAFCPALGGQATFRCCARRTSKEGAARVLWLEEARAGKLGPFPPRALPAGSRAPQALQAGPWMVRPGREPPDPRRTAGDRLR